MKRSSLTPLTLRITDTRATSGMCIYRQFTHVQFQQTTMPGIHALPFHVPANSDDNDMTITSPL
jgi:hypothetical protein